MKKTVCFVVFFALLFLMCGCATAPKEPLRVSFSISSCDIFEQSIDLPPIEIFFDDNSSDAISPDSFWFVPTDCISGALVSFVYVLDGQIHLNEESAPTEFEVDLVAVHKDDETLKSTLYVRKIQTNLEEVLLTSEHAKTKCQIGKSLQFFVTLLPEGGFDARPEGTSFRDFRFSVDWDKDTYPGRCASMTEHGGLLTVHSAAVVGMKLTVTVSVPAQENTIKSMSMEITVESAPY